MKKQCFVAALVSCAAAFAVPNAASAQGYPTRPITFIVPYGAGGPVDVLARALAEPMRQALGQSVVIENVVGANGTIGVGKAARAAPDGYTVSIGNWPSHITNGAIYNLNYDIQKDLIPVARLPQNPYIAVVRKDFPANTFQEFIAWLKANPDKATEGTAGVGSGQHISGVYVQKITGVKFQFVPYKSGSSEIIRDITAGHLDFTFDQAITSLSHIKGGNVRALAVTSDKRLAAAPARAAMADPAQRQRLTSLGQQIPPPEQQTAAALAAHTKAEVDKWHAIIKEAGIKVE